MLHHGRAEFDDLRWFVLGEALDDAARVRLEVHRAEAHAFALKEQAAREVSDLQLALQSTRAELYAMEQLLRGWQPCL